MPSNQPAEEHLVPRAPSWAVQHARPIPPFPASVGRLHIPASRGKSMPTPRGGWSRGARLAGMARSSGTSPERPLGDRSTPAASRRQVKSGVLLAITGVSLYLLLPSLLSVLSPWPSLKHLDLAFWRSSCSCSSWRAGSVCGNSPESRWGRRDGSRSRALAPYRHVEVAGELLCEAGLEVGEHPRPACVVPCRQGLQHVEPAPTPSQSKVG